MAALHRIILSSILAFTIGMVTSVQIVQAGERTLSVNSGSGRQVWFISGESSLVMNGFDLTSIGQTLPAVLDRASIVIETPVPGAAVEVVIYQDGNGGSPSDATVVGRRQVTIEQSGSFTVTFDPPVVITQPVVWVGFYLPVNTQFIGDTAGTSVLTYWAWTSGGTFDIGNLASAQVLGPADGSAPVGINMNGRAYITAEVSTATQAQASTTGTPAALSQTVINTTGNFGVMQAYSSCLAVLQDTADIIVSYRDGIDMYCREVWEGYSPPSPVGYFRRQLLYDISVYNGEGVISGDLLPLPVTHCIYPDAADLPSAVIGVASGSPREWRVLPTQRFNNVVCAEIPRGGNLSYFVPAPNGINVQITNAYISPVDPAPSQPFSVAATIRNQGTEASPATTVQVIIRNDRTGAETARVDLAVPALASNESVNVQAIVTITTYVNETHTASFRVDPSGGITEIDENDNEFLRQFRL